jgi:hypothetical protein
MDTDAVQMFLFANYMDLSIQEVILFLLIVSPITCILIIILVTFWFCMKDLSVMLDSELYFRNILIAYLLRH